MSIVSKAAAASILAICATVLSSNSASSAYPDKPIRLVVSFPAGGGSDTMARIVQPILEKELGQPVVIENRGGAGGMLGADLVAKAAPDGYTLGLTGAGALGTNLGLQTMPYDPRKDLKPVTGIATAPFILAASTSFRGKSLKDLIAMSKESGNTITIGHGGNGTLMHLTAEMLNQVAGTKIALVPYKGLAPLVNDLLGGHIALGIVDPPPAMAAIEADKIVPVAISSTKRFPAMPNIPTFAESGFPNFEAQGWFGIVAPGGTPADIIEKLNASFVKILKDPAVIQKIRTLGAEPMPMTPSEFSSFIEKEINKWEAVVKASALKQK